jgi:hypothetical protein
VPEPWQRSSEARYDKESDMRTQLSVVGVSLGFSFLLLSPAIARPVTSADLSGKKICWNNGDVETYYAGGKFSSNGGGDGTWAVSVVGVVVKANWNWVENLEKLADGTFTSAVSAGDQTQHFTGHYCK